MSIVIINGAYCVAVDCGYGDFTGLVNGHSEYAPRVAMCFGTEVKLAVTTQQALSL